MRGLKNALRLQLAPLAIFACLLLPTSAMAELAVQFREDAPKDRFIIENLGSCPLSQISLMIDLEGSAGGLIFDTVVDGAGINVAQPFELVLGSKRVSSVTPVGDGDRALTLSIDLLAPEEQIIFTIDLDDTLVDNRAGQTRVNGAEIEGARVRLRADALGIRDWMNAEFDQTARSLLPVTGCIS